MPRRFAAAFFGILIAVFVGFSATAQAATVATPSKITSLTAKAGPQAGEVTIAWKQTGKNTTGYQLETALSQFSKTKTSLPREGRNHHVFSIPGSARSITLTADQVADAGAAVGTGDHLYFRLAAVNKTAKGSTLRWYPKLQAVQPEVSTGNPAELSDFRGQTDLRMATFNVRTARATTDKRNWMARRDDVAKQIIARHPDIVTLQELGPGRADGKTGSVGDALRQTTSLLNALDDLGVKNYAMVRTTPYAEPGTEHGTQGTRILYNTDKVRLASDCVETTNKRNYSPTCAFDLPILDTDAASVTRSVNYAQFVDRDTRKAFYVVAAHLDERHSDSQAKEASYDGLRGQQARAILAKMDTINDDKLPVLIGSDLNSNQGLQVGNAPHDVFTGAGFTDAASARVRINMEYSTFNGFDTTQKVSAMKFGSRLDTILVKGATPVTYENVTKKTDPNRPSDHNMVFATLVLNK